MNPYHAYRLELGKGQMGECIFKMLNFLKGIMAYNNYSSTSVGKEKK